MYEYNVEFQCSSMSYDPWANYTRDSQQMIADYIY